MDFHSGAAEHSAAIAALKAEAFERLQDSREAQFAACNTQRELTQQF